MYEYFPCNLMSITVDSNVDPAAMRTVIGRRILQSHGLLDEVIERQMPIDLVNHRCDVVLRVLEILIVEIL